MVYQGGGSGAGMALEPGGRPANPTAEGRRTPATEPLTGPLARFERSMCSWAMGTHSGENGMDLTAAQVKEIAERCDDLHRPRKAFAGEAWEDPYGATYQLKICDSTDRVGTKLATWHLSISDATYHGLPESRKRAAKRTQGRPDSPVGAVPR